MLMTPVFHLYKLKNLPRAFDLCMNRNVTSDDLHDLKNYSFLNHIK